MSAEVDTTRLRDEARSSWPAYIAHATLAYPLFPVLALYGEWLLASYLLGHIPIPGQDDPKFIDGSNWLHPIVSLAILGAGPIAIFAMVTNVNYVATRAIQRHLWVLCLWLGMVVLIAWDPGRVIYWWLD